MIFEDRYSSIPLGSSFKVKLMGLKVYVSLVMFNGIFVRDRTVDFEEAYSQRLNFFLTERDVETRRRMFTDDPNSNECSVLGAGRFEKIKLVVIVKGAFGYGGRLPLELISLFGCRRSGGGFTCFVRDRFGVAPDPINNI